MAEMKYASSRDTNEVWIVAKKLPEVRLGHSLEVMSRSGPHLAAVSRANTWPRARWTRRLFRSTLLMTRSAAKARRALFMESLPSVARHRLAATIGARTMACM